jgi:transcriptional regulator with XRE-family HTH domain
MEKSTHTPEYEALRSKLRATRESAGLSQRRLAARLKVPHSWVAKIESGERRIDLVEFAWFMSACGIEPISACQHLLREMGVKRKRKSQPKGGRNK